METRRCRWIAPLGLAQLLLGLALLPSAATAHPIRRAAGSPAQPVGQRTSQGLAVTERHSYLVRLEGPALLAVRNRAVGRFATSSPERIRTLQAMMRQHQDEVARAIEAEGAAVVGTYQAALNGLQIVAAPDQLRRIVRLPGVVAIEPLPVLEPQLDRAVGHIGARQALEELGWDGRGVTVAIIDSGIDYTHQAFGGLGRPEAWQMNDPTVVEPGSFPTAKVVGGYDFAGELYSESCPPDAPPDECSQLPAPDNDPLDGPGGHGSHIAAIVAGQGGEGLPAGTAPGAQLVALKVFGTPLGYEWTTALWGLALEWAISHNLGLAVVGSPPEGQIDVVNLSIGGAWSTRSQLTEDLVAAAVEAGMVVIAASGNDGARPYVVSSPSSAELAVSVAGSELPGTSALLLAAEWRDADGSGRLLPEPIAVSGTSDWLPQLSETGPVEAELAWYGFACGNETPAQPVAERVALIERGRCAFFDKIWNAQRQGARAVVVFSDWRDKAPMGCVPPSNCDQRPAIPAVMIDRAVGLQLRSWILQPGRSVTVRLDDAQRIDLGDAVMPQSSRGPARAHGLVKPQVVAPGDLIRSADASSGRGTVAYSGTSVAAPFASGVVALLWQAERARSADQPVGPLLIAAKLLNYARPRIQDEHPATGRLAPATRQGAGLIDAYGSLRGSGVVRVAPGIAELSFGHLHLLDDGHEEQVRFVRELEVANRHATEERRYRLSALFREAADREHGIDLLLPAAGVRLGPGEEQSVPVELSIATRRLPGWPLGDELTLYDEQRYREPEVDGWIHLEQVDESGTPVADGEQLVVPFQALPRRHGCVVAENNAFRLSESQPQVAQSWHNACRTAGRLEVYHHVLDDAQESRTIPGFDPAVDIVSVGMRWGAAPQQADAESQIEWVIQTAGSRRLPFDTEFRIYLDLDGDGRFDRSVITLPEQLGPDFTGRWLVGVAPVTHGQGLPEIQFDQLAAAGVLAFDLDEAATRVAVPAPALGLAEDALPPWIGVAVEAVAVSQDRPLTDRYPGFDRAPDLLESGVGARFATPRLNCIAVLGPDGQSISDANQRLLVPAQASAAGTIVLRPGCQWPRGIVPMDLVFRYPDNMPGRDQIGLRRGSKGGDAQATHLPWASRP